MTIDERKESLVNKLKLLRLEKLSEFQFLFMGNCGEPHIIETMPTEQTTEVLPLPGEFFMRNSCPDCSHNKEKLCLYIGQGKGCDYDDEEDDDVFWFIMEGNEGVTYVHLDVIQSGIYLKV